MHKQTLFLMALSGRSIAWPEGDPRAAKPLLMKSTFKEKKNKQKSLILQNPGTETTRLNETKIEKKRSQFTVEFLVQGEGSVMYSQRFSDKRRQKQLF